MNFGTVKNIFVEKLVESHISGEKIGKNLYKKFLETLKESETLKTAFVVYKNIEGNTINDKFEANQYLKENLSLIEKFNGKKSLTEQTKKLISILKENDIKLDDIKSNKLHESLNILLTKTKTLKTINQLYESRINVIDWLSSDKTKEEKSEYVKENINPNKFLDLVVNKFNEKYSELTEEEKNILKILKESNEDDLKNMVSNLIKDNINIINENLNKYSSNINIKAKLLETKDTIYKMVDSNVELGEKVLKLYDLKNKFKNE